MRRSLFLIILLSAALRVDAQSCAIQGFQQFRPTGPDCRFAYPSDVLWHCSPGSLILDIQTVPVLPASCPTPVLTWTFSDTTTPVVTNGLNVEHTFAPGVHTVRAASGSKSMEIKVGVHLGTFTIASIPPVREDAGSVTISISRNESSQSATVDYVAGPAESVTPISGTLSFAAGETQKQVVVPIVNETFWRPEREATLTFRNPSPAYSLNWGYQTLPVPFTILDDEREVRFDCAQRSLEVNESAGTASLELLRSGGLDAPGTAVFKLYRHAKNFALEATHTASFAPGSNRATATFPINDSVYIGSRAYDVHCYGYLGTAPPYLEPPDVMGFTILEDEPYPSISVSPIAITEGDFAIVEFPISPRFGEPASVNISIIDGTAERGKDYTFGSSSNTVGVVANAPSIRFPIATIDDAQAENDEQFVVHFLSIAGVRREKFTVTILDDDRPPYSLTLDKAAYEFVEGGTNSVTVTRGGATTSAATALLHFNTTDPAQWSIDLAVPFAAGETSKTLLVPFNDDWLTGYRSAKLEVITAGYVAASAPVTMSDDDPMPVLSIAGGGEIVEGAKGETKSVELTLSLNAPIGVDLHLDIVTTPGTANADDYVALDKETFFAPGSLSKKVSVEIRGDYALEPDETFKVEIKDCCSALALIAQQSATITILNDDDGTIDDTDSFYRFERPIETFRSESQKWLTATVIRSGGAKRATTVQARLTAGSARTFTPLDVRFRVNETSKVLRFYIDDAFYSGNASGTLELFAGTKREDSFAVVITENESKPVIRIDNLTLAEDTIDRSVGFLVSITPPSFDPIDAKIALSLYGASATTDFSGLRNGRQIVIPALESTMLLDFTLLGDKIQESEESFHVSLTVDPSIATMKGGGVCKIVDPPSHGWRLTTPSTLARGANATVVLMLPYGFSEEQEVRVTTSTPDLVSVPAKVTIPRNKITGTFDVTGLRAGQAIIEVELPRWVNSTIVSAPLFVYSLTTPIVPELVKVPVGGTASVTITLPVPADDEMQISISSMDRSIAATDPSAMLPPTGGTFDVYGASIGKTTLSITLPMELGGMTVQVPVEVLEPIIGKTRAARH
ncbi:MAG TPA: Calx-beta domain-containing protein [Thermoanaerobaculia bacterium]|jgi:hypothetical protein|nr:Calx-beta domain-containing protein [Thermoanaerobaculia bacterium]